MYSTSKDFGTSKKKQILGKLVGVQNFFRLNKPADIATDSQGRIYVADKSLRVVVVFDEKNREVWSFGKTAQRKLVSPTGIAIDSRDRIFVADSQQNIVFIYNNNNGVVTGHLGGVDIFNRPTWIAIDEDRERIYVSSTRNNRIDVFNLNGKHLFDVGEMGVDPRGENVEQSAGKFFAPTYLSLDKDGNIYVTGFLNCRIKILDPRGKPISTIGRCGNRPREFARPKGIALDSEGHIYVVDAAFNNVQIFDKAGRLLLIFSGAGHGPGTFDLPAGIHIDKNDIIYVVADTFHIPQIQVF